MKSLTLINESNGIIILGKLTKGYNISLSFERHNNQKFKSKNILRIYTKLRTNHRRASFFRFSCFLRLNENKLIG